MDVIIFPGVVNQERLKNSTIAKKESESVSSSKLLSEAFKALNTYKIKSLDK
ncbi:hypothetical protein ACIP9G_02105 [Lysinibacillus sp. NPDC093197]|uniref:hypothetical protein n=1 Tax=Lysinibacillus sp. NPDC093197 TaxID=3364132 RepID=UPI003818965C